MTTEAPAFESIAPIFSVRDVQEALAFYVDALGFALGWSWGDPPTYASVCRGAVEINLGLPAEGGAMGTSSAYVAVSDVDLLHARLVAGGTAMAVAIGDRAYGMRDFTVADPSGNQLTFGAPVAG